MAKGLFAKKSIHDLKEEASNRKDGLDRSLTGLNLMSMGIGAIVGAGVFVLVGQAAAVYAGPAVVFSFLFAAIICVFAALCYAEFASLIPVAGGPYSYAYATLGEIVAWTIGWGLTLEYLFSAATVSVGWSGYLSSFLADFNIFLPEKFASSPLSYDITTGWARTGSILNLPAMLIMGFIGCMISIGIKAASRFNNIVVIIKLTVIVLFIVCGISFISVENWTPFIPKNTGAFGEFGFSGILRGAGVVFFAYIGFDALSTLAQEARDPQKDLPIGMIGSLGIAASIYIVMALVLTGIVSYTALGGPAPFSVALAALGNKFIWLRYFAKFGILAGLSSVVLVMMLGQTRIFYTMAHDGLLPKVFGKVHKKFHTPFYNTILLTILGMLVCGFFPVGILGQLVSMGTLMAFGIVCFGVLVLRYRQPNLHRPFKVPFFPWIPLAGTLACLLQMIALPAVTWVQLVIWIFFGYIIYFSYGIRNSVIRKKNKKIS
ncbi:MAG: putative amino acid permease YhdG [Chlamydiae bacterium]|nr:putative amino acid permease YhdG [Chlamydiota bacterium]